VSDTRKRGYAVYDELSFEPIVETRAIVLRAAWSGPGKSINLFDLIYQSIGKIPETEIDVKVVGNPTCRKRNLHAVGTAPRRGRLLS